jgi:hypothetical protein
MFKFQKSTYENPLVVEIDGIDKEILRSLMEDAHTNSTDC